MIIKQLHINKFRGFSNVDCEVGSHITVIAGQNGTQKTTILGLISQPFSITDPRNPMHGERPLSGGNFKSAFSEKFRLSDEFDRAGDHEWTLYFRGEGIQPFTVESILRDHTSGKIRFWRKGNRAAGSGYVQYPVIYLSLKRLYPIGEDGELAENNNINYSLTEQESLLYQDWYKRVLLLPRENIVSVNHLSSKIKQTAGINTDKYNWETNSAGQDNLGKILLAIISLKRLKENYPDDYKGGILAIDELDAALYPASQVKLFDLLHNVAQDYKIQVFFTTHSLTLIERASQFREQHEAEKEKIKIVFLEKKDDNVIIKERDFNYIKNNLEVSLGISESSKKIDIYCEDDEAIIFSKKILGRNITSHTNFVKVNLGCKIYKTLIKHKIPSFSRPNSIIILDGDARESGDNRFRNLIYLPNETSPERIIAKHLHDLPDSDTFRETVNDNFTCQLCFSEYLYEDIQNNREKAKKRWNSDIIKPNLNKIINHRKVKNSQDVLGFKLNFLDVFNNIANERGFSTLH